MSASHDDYQLLDFGAGRKLEQFGSVVLDRPCPAAEDAERGRPDLWEQATARFERHGEARGNWVSAAKPIGSWMVRFSAMTLELRRTPSGQVGVFPEQAENWRWIAQSVRAAGRVKVLNLFAYTGASTLAAAAAGAEVVHVDAAANVVAWARQNARASRWDHLPIRWITEDVLRFVRRELKRGHRYDAVILDPPAYGHGPKGESWKLEEGLDELLPACWELCRGEARFLLLSCHSGRLGRAGELLEYAIARQPSLKTTGTASGVEMGVISVSGQRLHQGAAVRWERTAR